MDDDELTCETAVVRRPCVASHAGARARIARTQETQTQHADSVINQGPMHVLHRHLLILPLFMFLLILSCMPLYIPHTIVVFPPSLSHLFLEYTSSSTYLMQHNNNNIHEKPLLFMLLHNHYPSTSPLNSPSTNSCMNQHIFIHPPSLPSLHLNIIRGPLLISLSLSFFFSFSFSFTFGFSFFFFRTGMLCPLAARLEFDLWYSMRYSFILIWIFQLSLFLPHLSFLLSIF